MSPNLTSPPVPGTALRSRNPRDLQVAREPRLRPAQGSPSRTSRFFASMLLAGTLLGSCGMREVPGHSHVEQKDAGADLIVRPDSDGHKHDAQDGAVACSPVQGPAMDCDSGVSSPRVYKGQVLWFDGFGILLKDMVTSYGQNYAVMSIVDMECAPLISDDLGTIEDGKFRFYDFVSGGTSRHVNIAVNNLGPGATPGSLQADVQVWANGCATPMSCSVKEGCAGEYIFTTVVLGESGGLLDMGWAAQVDSISITLTSPSGGSCQITDKSVKLTVTDTASGYSYTAVKREGECMDSPDICAAQVGINQITATVGAPQGGYCPVGGKKAALTVLVPDFGS